MSARSLAACAYLMSTHVADLLDSHKGERCKGEGRVRDGSGRENAAAYDEQIRMIVAAAGGVDDGVMLAGTHTAGAHDVARRIPIIHIEIRDIRLWREGRSHGAEELLGDLETFLERLLRIVVDCVGNLRPRNAEGVHLVRQAHLIVRVRKLLGREAEAYHLCQSVDGFGP